MEDTLLPEVHSPPGYQAKHSSPSAVPYQQRHRAMHAQLPQCRSLLLLWIAIILLCSAITASGQGLFPERSPFFAAPGQRLTLAPTLSVGERYDDNIFETDSNKIDDFVTIISPGIQLRYLPMRDAALDLAYRADFEIFADQTDENSVSHRALLKFTGPLTRSLSIDAGDTLIITEEPITRRLEIGEETGGRPVSEQSRERTLRNNANVRLDVQLAPRVLLGLLFASLIDDVNVPQEVDEYRYTLGAEFGYLVHLARASRVTVAYDVDFHTFAQNAGGITAADFNVHSALVGFRHAFSPTLSGNAAIGYSVVTSDDPIQDGESAIVGNIGIIKTLRTGQIAANYRRDFTTGGGQGESALADIFTATLTINITSKVTASLGTNLSFFNFQEAQAREDDRLFWTIRPSLAYQALRVWRLFLAYDYALTDYDPATTADRYDHRVIFLSQLMLKEQLFLNLSYIYRSRQSSTGTTVSGTQSFDRNEITLMLTYAPTFRF
jgi:hypothetical protein